MEDITLTIDGQEVRGKRGDTILNVCERNGIDVPTLCHFKGLTDIGACRVCVVEIEGARGLSTACTTPASTGMVVRTNTPALNALRKSIVELLFAERNHFCMFCELSGDCELQKLGYRFGIDAVHYPYMNPKLSVDSSSPYFVLDHNRCVLCRRCVRACTEIAGVSTLGYRERGSATMVNFDLNASAAESTCEACGVCVQVCPTGALFDKRSAYKGRLADCLRIQSACQGCSVGCQVTGVVRARTILRIDGDFEQPPSYGLLCARGRYESLDGRKERILRPAVRRHGRLGETTFDEALDYLAERLAAVKHARGSKQIVALATAGATSEALYLLDWVFRGGFGAKFAIVGSEEATARAAALRRVAGAAPNVEQSYGALRQADYVLVLGADPAQTHPVVASVLRRSASRGLSTIALVGDPSNVLAAHACVTLTPRPGSEGVLINGLMKVILSEGLARTKPLGLASALHRYTPAIVQATTGVPAADLVQVARSLAGARAPMVIYGGPVIANADLAASALSLALLIGRPEDKKVAAMGLAQGSNGVAAARLAGTRGLAEAAGAAAAFVMLGDQPAGDLAQQLGELEFLAVQAAYPSPLTERADVVLPARIWAERHGTFVAGDGTVRKLAQLVSPPADLMDDLELIAALGTRLGATASFTESALAAKVETALAMPAANLDRAAPVCVDYL